MSEVCEVYRSRVHGAKLDSFSYAVDRVIFASWFAGLMAECEGSVLRGRGASAKS